MKTIFYNLLLLAVAWLVMGKTVGIYQEKFLDKQIKQEANKINLMLNDYFEYLNHFNVFMGKQIAQHGAHDLGFILNTFRSNMQSDVIGNKIYSWSAYDWVDDQDYQLVNTKNGISKDDPPDMSIRNYSRTARAFPWSLQLDPPTMGNPSHSWVIPAATGITDNKGNYLGAIVVGINVQLLESSIEERLNSGLSFVIASPDGELLLKSSSVFENNWYKDQFDLKSQIIHGNVDKPITPRLLDSPVVVDKIMFKNLSYVQKYPLIILTGYDQQLFDYEVAKIVNPAMMQLLFLLIYCNLWFFFKENSLEKKRGKNFHKKGTS